MQQKQKAGFVITITSVKNGEVLEHRLRRGSSGGTIAHIVHNIVENTMVFYHNRLSPKCANVEQHVDCYSIRIPPTPINIPMMLKLLKQAQETHQTTYSDALIKYHLDKIAKIREAQKNTLPF